MDLVAPAVRVIDTQLLKKDKFALLKQKKPAKYCDCVIEALNKSGYQLKNSV